VQEFCGLTATYRQPQHDNSMHATVCRMSVEMTSGRQNWKDSVRRDLHPFPACNRRLLCDEWLRKRPRKSWWSVVCSLRQCFNVNETSLWCLRGRIYRLSAWVCSGDESGVNSASTYPTFLHFSTTSPSVSRRLVNGKSSACTSAHPCGL